MKKIVLGLMVAGLGLAFACPGVQGCGCMGSSKGDAKIKEHTCPGSFDEQGKMKPNGHCGMPACGGASSGGESPEVIKFGKDIDEVLNGK